MAGQRGAGGSMIDGSTQLCSVWSRALIQERHHGDHREAREEAETCKASSGLDSEMLYYFCHIVLAKASHNASPS